jgi:hypothetical protein
MPTAVETAIGIEAILVLWIGVRSYRSYQGRLYSAGRVLVFPVLILLLFLSTEYDTIVAVPWALPLWTIVDLVVLTAAALATLPLAPRLVRVTRRDDGEWYYQYGIELIAVYLGLWVVRLGLAAYFDPSSIEFVTPTGPAPSATASEVLVLIQGLFSISSGLVIGRGVGTYRLHEQAQKTLPTGTARPRQP